MAATLAHKVVTNRGVRFLRIARAEAYGVKFVTAAWRTWLSQSHLIDTLFEVLQLLDCPETVLRDSMGHLSLRDCQERGRIQLFIPFHERFD